MTNPLAPSLLALAVAGLAMFVAWNQAPAALLPPNIESLEGRVARLERDLTRVREEAVRPVPMVPATAAPAAAPVAGPDQATAQRLERLEQQFAQVAQLAGRQVPARVETPRAPVAPPAEQAAVDRQQAEADPRLAVQQMTQKFIDPAQTEAVRLQALRALRGAGPGARSGAVASTAIALVQTSQNAETRADVWRQMNGAKEQVLVPHLLTSLQTDQDGRVRKEAAETLGDFVEQPEVQAALRAANTGDADEGVRRQAEQILGRIARNRR